MICIINNNNNNIYCNIYNYSKGFYEGGTADCKKCHYTCLQCDNDSKNNCI